MPKDDDDFEGEPEEIDDPELAEYPASCGKMSPHEDWYEPRGLPS